MLQNTRNRLVAPGFASPAGADTLEALVFEPWHDLTTDMNRLVSAVFRPDGTAAGSPNGNADPVPTWVPAVDVEERADAIRLAVEVPGVDPNALTVAVDGRVLTVSGERPFARPEGDTGKSAYRVERRYGPFARRLTLPETVDLDRIQARYEHGVLHLELPKRPEAQPRRIAIATGSAARGDQRQLEVGTATA